MRAVYRGVLLAVGAYTQQIGDRWAAVFVEDGVPPPGPGTLKGLAFFGTTPDEAERVAKEYLGLSEPAN